jgi:HEPN domain-containing protein
MTLDEKFEYWKSYAKRDLDAAGAMYDTGRWFYVLIMSQQAVEKMVKGVYCYHVDDNVPRTHNIEMLANKIEDDTDISFGEGKYQLFRTLTKYYLADRYPDFLGKSGLSVDKSLVSGIFEEVKEVFAWLLTLKPPKD